MIDTRIIPEGNLAEKALPPGEQRSGNSDFKKASLLKKGLLAYVISVIINSAIFLAAKASGLQFAMVNPSNDALQAITVLNVLISVAVGVIGASIVFWIIAKFAKNPAVVFQIVAFVFLIASFAGPILMLPDSDTIQKAILASMHVVVAVVTVPLLLKTLRV